MSSGIPEILHERACQHKPCPACNDKGFYRPVNPGSFDPLPIQPCDLCKRRKQAEADQTEKLAAELARLTDRRAMMELACRDLSTATLTALGKGGVKRVLELAGGAQCGDEAAMLELAALLEKLGGVE